MPRGKRCSQQLIDDIVVKVRAYQSEHNSSLCQSYRAVAKDFNINWYTVRNWCRKSQGKNPVISTVAKKKEVKKQQTKVAATSVSASAQLDAEKIIFDYVKKLGFFKRVLAVIIGLDKLCYNYGSKSLHK